MNPKCVYPQYELELPANLMQQCVDLAPRLLNEVGFSVPSERFLGHLEGKKGIRIDKTRVFFDKDFVKKYVEKIIARRTESLRESIKTTTKPPEEWTVKAQGYALMTIDVETEQLREATSGDLRDMINLINSFGIPASYPVMPQDVPVTMQALNGCKICLEMSDKVKMMEFQQPGEIPFMYEMHRLVGRSLLLPINIPTSFTVDKKDLDNFLDFYDLYKKNGDLILSVNNYSMTGITKPITVPGCATMCFTESLAVHILFNLFDAEIETGISLGAGMATDMRNTCWAFGSPRNHMYRYMGSLIWNNLCDCAPQTFTLDGRVRLETASSAIDEQAAIEKTAPALVGALQGARNFQYAGSLCVDDVFSGTQLVIDLEIIDYVKETIEAFNPHPDIIDIEGLYEECRDVGLGKDTFISHINTAKRFRNILPSSDLLVREKLRSWMGHQKILKDRAREVAMDRIKNAEPFHLPDDKQKELDKIYQRALKKLS